MRQPKGAGPVTGDAVSEPRQVFGSTDGRGRQPLSLPDSKQAIWAELRDPSAEGRMTANLQVSWSEDRVRATYEAAPTTPVAALARTAGWSRTRLRRRVAAWRK